MYIHIYLCIYIYIQLPSRHEDSGQPPAHTRAHERVASARAACRAGTKSRGQVTTPLQASLAQVGALQSLKLILAEAKETIDIFMQNGQDPEDDGAGGG